jgi:hypothetical protein
MSAQGDGESIQKPSEMFVEAEIKLHVACIAEGK